MSASAENPSPEICFNAGDLIITETVSADTEFKSGEVITFISGNEDNYGETVTHAIYDVKRNDAGEIIGYVTYGVHTGAIDESLVVPESVIAKYVDKVPDGGKFFNFLKTSKGYFLCIFTPFFLLMLYWVIKILLLFSKYRKAQERKAVAVSSSGSTQEQMTANDIKLKELEIMLYRLKRENDELKRRVDKNDYYKR
jgi:signal peptidase